MSEMIITEHPEVGYENNVVVIETALREHFGLDDNSHALRAVAATIWSSICHKMDSKQWGTWDINRAIAVVQARLNIMTSQLLARPNQNEKGQ